MSLFVDNLEVRRKKTDLLKLLLLILIRVILLFLVHQVINILFIK